MKRISNIKMPVTTNEDDLIKKCKQLLKRDEITYFEIIKKSVDARDKNNIFFVYTVDIKTNDEDKIRDIGNISSPILTRFSIPKSLKIFDKRPIIVGMGPSGLFAALTLVKSGILPIIIEQGKKVEERQIDVERLFKEGILNPLSNVQFGEGGAGTFSDGKLTTGTNDERVRYVLEIFVEFGAPKEILYSHKPHIGTDILKDVVKNIREYLIDNGCDIRFNTKMTDLIIEDNILKGIVINDKEEILSNHVLIGVGHSSRDTYEMLYNKNIKLEQKKFAMGVRIEHKQEMIQKAQYGSFAKEIEPTDYKLVSHLPNGRSVYTFCVCPGGHVVAASTEVGHLAINGMSEYKRDNKNINGALLVTIEPKDFPSSNPLAGIYLQRDIERKSFDLGGSNYYAPCQNVGDFLMKKSSTDIGKIIPSYKPGYKLCSLDDCLPSYITESLRSAILEFDKKIKGFATEDAILTAVESRSSSPVRILRDDTYNSVSIKGLFPIGEGAGYAGGIMTSAIDGIKCVEQILR